MPRLQLTRDVLGLGLGLAHLLRFPWWSSHLSFRSTSSRLKASQESVSFVQSQNARPYSPQSCRIWLPRCCFLACGQSSNECHWSRNIVRRLSLTSFLQAAAKEFRNLRAFQELPNIAYTRSTVGWYQGSGFLILTGMSCPWVKEYLENLCFILTNILLALLNLSWAQNPKSLDEPLQRSMAALLVLISWASSAWYIRRGVKASGFLTAFAGVLQAWAALHWSLFEASFRYRQIYKLMDKRKCLKYPNWTE